VTTGQGVLGAILGLSLVLNFVCAAAWVGVVLRRHLEGRRLKARWQEMSQDYRIIQLPSRCTCCPEHGPAGLVSDPEEMRRKITAALYAHYDGPADEERVADLAVQALTHRETA